MITCWRKKQTRLDGFEVIVKQRWRRTVVLEDGTSYKSGPDRRFWLCSGGTGETRMVAVPQTQSQLQKPSLGIQKICRLGVGRPFAHQPFLRTMVRAFLAGGRTGRR